MSLPEAAQGDGRTIAWPAGGKQPFPGKHQGPDQQPFPGKQQDPERQPFPGTQPGPANAATIPFPEHQSKSAAPEPPKRSGFWRELAGAMAAGVVILAAVVFVLEVISWTRGVPGLGVVVLIGHVVGAGLAVVAQRQVDRRTGRGALVAGAGVGAVVVALLVLFWWT